VQKLIIIIFKTKTDLMRYIYILILLLSFNLLSCREALAQTINTIAGNGTKGYSGDDSLAVHAMLNQPADVCTDAAGNIYIADQYNDRVRKVDAATGKITTVAGDGTPGYTGDSALAAFVGLYWPIAIAVDAANNLYISDCLNNRIRKVDLSTGWIVTIAGDSTGGYSGDGGPATKAQISYPAGITVDKKGNVYFSDFGNAVIRKINAVTGIITTVAGNGLSGFTGDGGPATSAKLLEPSGIAVDAAGNLYIADEGNNRIRRVSASTGTITTVCGNGTAGYTGDGSLASSAELNAPQDIFVDAANNLFITDLNNNVIRKIDGTTGKINTVAGDGTTGYSGDGDLATTAKMRAPEGLCLSATGDIFIADQGNNVIRKVSGPVSVVQLKKIQFEIFPNPSKETFSVCFNNGGNNFNIEVYDVAGKVVYNGISKKEKTTINLTNVAAGEYFISVKTGDAKAMQKIIITH
jgi:sugar lactone lactonase YvrE